MEIITQSAQETQTLGEKIGHDLAFDKLRPRILCLYGELGSGKTTFLQGLAKGWGVKKRVTSPTFVFMKQYQPLFYHVDLYRVEKVKEAKGLGLEEIFNNPEAIVVIEWAERIKSILPKKRIDFCFNYVSEQERKIIIKNK